VSGTYGTWVEGSNRATVASVVFVSLKSSLKVALYDVEPSVSETHW